MLCLKQLEKRALSLLQSSLPNGVNVAVYGGQFSNVNNLSAANPKLPCVWVWAEGLETGETGDGLIRGVLTLKLVAAANTTGDTAGEPGVFSLLARAHAALEEWVPGHSGPPVLKATKSHAQDSERGLAVYISTYHLNILTKHF